LLLLERIIRNLNAERVETFMDIQLLLTVTIDTDSLMICTLNESAMRCTNAHKRKSLHTLLCMRERATPTSRSSFLVADVGLLETKLQDTLWKDIPPPSSEETMASSISLAAVAALCGCDFTGGGAGGARFDYMFEYLVSFIAGNRATLLELLQARDPDPDIARRAVEPLHRICEHAASELFKAKPRYKKQSGKLAHPCQILLLRSIWTSAYWMGVEHKCSMHLWGGPSHTHT
jgi:hypothetical protein